MDFTLCWNNSRIRFVRSRIYGRKATEIWVTLLDLVRRRLKWSFRTPWISVEDFYSYDLFSGKICYFQKDKLLDELNHALLNVFEHGSNGITCICLCGWISDPKWPNWPFLWQVTTRSKEKWIIRLNFHSELDAVMLIIELFWRVYIGTTQEPDIPHNGLNALA